MDPNHDKRFPNESPEYREARERLLEAELELRQQTEEVARLRRQLPLGGEIEENYEFEEMAEDGSVRTVQFSSLFDPHDSLILYSFMYGPDWEKPCPMCTSVMDGVDGNIQYVQRRAGFAMVAKAPIDKLAAWGRERGWRRIRLLSSCNNSFNADYNAEFPSDYGDQHPVMHVFTKRDGKIHHFWSSEVLYVPSQTDPRHVDPVWPLWNLLDLTPQGRGDLYPKYEIK